MRTLQTPSGETVIPSLEVRMRLSSSWRRNGRGRMAIGWGKSCLLLRRIRYVIPSWAYDYRAPASSLLPRLSGERADAWIRLPYSSGTNSMTPRDNGGAAMDWKTGPSRKMEGCRRGRWAGTMLRFPMRRGGTKMGWMSTQLRFRKSIGEKASHLTWFERIGPSGIGIWYLTPCRWKKF